MAVYFVFIRLIAGVKEPVTVVLIFWVLLEFGCSHGLAGSKNGLRKIALSGGAIRIEGPTDKQFLGGPPKISQYPGWPACPWVFLYLE